MNTRCLPLMVFVVISIFIGGCDKKMVQLENDTISWLQMLPKDNPGMLKRKAIDSKWQINYDESIVDDVERVEKWHSEWVLLGKDNIPNVARILERF